MASREEKNSSMAAIAAIAVKALKPASRSCGWRKLAALHVAAGGAAWRKQAWREIGRNDSAAPQPVAIGNIREIFSRYSTLTWRLKRRLAKICLKTGLTLCLCRLVSSSGENCRGCRENRLAASAAIVAYGNRGFREITSVILVMTYRRRK
jgi:hypothetical protein